ILLPVDFAGDTIVGISLSKGTAPIGANLSITGKTLTISPSNYLEGDSTYSVKIYTKGNKKYILNLVAKDTFDYDRHDRRFVSDYETQWPDLTESTGDRVLEITAKPGRGFNYPYFLLIPSGTTENNDNKFMVVESTN